MADLVFILARTELKQYLYLKHFGRTSGGRCFSTAARANGAGV